LGVLLGLTIGYTAGPDRVAFAQSHTARVQQVSSEVDAAATRLDLINSTYILPATVDDTYLAQHRVADGRLLFVLGDYARASVVFLDIVENSTNRRTSAYYDARFYLAESLFLSRNLAAARGFYEEIIDDNGDPRHADAMKRLLEVRFLTRSYGDIRELYRQLDQNSEARNRADIIYVRGKSLYFQEEYLDATAEFARVPVIEPEYIQAQYFRGVSFARLEEYERAIGSFEAAVRAGENTTNENADEIVALAWIAIGRVNYELGEATLARDAYQSVSRTSDHYDRALYEMCWTYIADERYRDALNTLEILLLAVPDSRFRPNAQLLRGDLLMRMADYQGAMAIFDGTVEEFGPLRDQLQSVIRAEANPDEYFETLIDSASASLLMPDIAREWVEDDETMRRALTLVGDLDQQGAEIEESREIIAELEVVLDSTSRIDVYPEMRQAFGQSLELQHSLLMLLRRLVDVESELALTSVDATSRQQYQQLQLEREGLERQMAALPTTYEEMTAREGAVENRIGDMEMEIFRLGYEVETQNAQLRALRLQIREEHSMGLRSDESLEAAEAELAEFQAALDELDEVRDQMRQELERERLATGLGTLSANSLQGLRARYREVLTDQRDTLAPFRGSLSDGASAVVGDVDTHRGRIGALERELADVFANIEDIVERRTREIRRQVDIESALIDDYDRQLRVFGERGERLAGEIAFENFIAVQSQFSELILRADVGIIDVAWREKEDRSTRIGLLFDERNEQLEILDVEFREVLEGE